MFQPLSMIFYLHFISYHFMTVNGTIRCLDCESYRSLEDCHRARKLGVCDYDEKRCISVHYEAGEFSRWYKGCSKQELCQPEIRCPDVYAKCEVSCCAESMCNGSNKVKSSIVVTLGICVFLLLHIR